MRMHEKKYRFHCVVRARGSQEPQFYHHDLFVDSWNMNPDSLGEYWQTFLEKADYLEIENQIGFKTKFYFKIVAEIYHLLYVEEISSVRHVVEEAR